MAIHYQPINKIFRWRFVHALTTSLMFLCAAPSLAQSVRNDQIATEISGNGGRWGSWSRVEFCPPNSWAAGYTMRVEPEQGSGDDTALNAIALYCRDRSGRDVARISPHDGHWGEWVEGASCTQGAFLTYFQLKVEPWQRDGDDTAANSIAFWCSNKRRIEAAGGTWGTWGEWQGGFSNAGVCGIRVKVEAPIGSGDDTALNDVELTWCKR